MGHSAARCRRRRSVEHGRLHVVYRWAIVAGIAEGRQHHDLTRQIAAHLGVTAPAPPTTTTGEDQP